MEIIAIPHTKVGNTAFLDSTPEITFFAYNIFVSTLEASPDLTLLAWVPRVIDPMRLASQIKMVWSSWHD